MRVAEMLKPEHIPLMSAAELLRFNSLALADDLSLFMREAWPIVEPSTPFIPGWHIDAIAEHLEAVTAGQIKRLIINVPPGFTKSLITTVFWPAWEWARDPSSRWIFATYESGLATRFSIRRRAVMSSDWYRARWPGVVFSSDQNVKTEFQNTAKGEMFSCGFGGNPTGHHCSRLAIDDPINPKKAMSDVERESAIDFWRTSLSTRLIPPDEAAVAIIMQRLHQRDLTGYLLAEEAGAWTHLCLPMEAPTRSTIVLPSGRKIEREAGDLLCPDRFGRLEVETLKLSLGSYGASGQLQQEPSPEGGGMLKRDWWKFYALPPDDLETVIQSWDAAFKETADSDFVVGQVWGKKGANIYLLDQVRGRMDFPATLTAIRTLSDKWPNSVTKLVEDKANGPAVIAMLRDRIPGMIAIEPRGSKEARASAVSPLIEAGNVHLPESSAFVNDFIEECAAFPMGAHDDQVDAMTQALDRLTLCEDGIIGYYRNLVAQIEQRPTAPAAPAPLQPAAQASELIAEVEGRRPHLLKIITEDLGGGPPAYRWRLEAPDGMAAPCGGPYPTEQDARSAAALYAAYSGLQVESVAA